MSNKAYNRGSEVISRSFDRKEEVRAGRILDQMNSAMERLERENESLKAELEKARGAYHRRTAELAWIKDELRQVQEAEKINHDNYVLLFTALCNEQKGHQKLTAVMKTALTPEQYHDARARAAEAYPELFSK